MPGIFAHGESRSEGGPLALAGGAVRALRRLADDRDRRRLLIACGPLTEAERSDVRALAAILYPPDTDDEAHELTSIVDEWTTGRTEQDGRLLSYRQGLRLLSAEVSRQFGDASFHELPPAARRRVVERLAPMGRGWRGGDASSLMDLVRIAGFHLFCGRRWRFRQYLVADLLLGIYGSALGWRLWGYSVRPGVEGDRLAYTRRPVP